MNRVQVPEHEGFSLVHPIYTDGSAPLTGPVLRLLGQQLCSKTYVGGEKGLPKSLIPSRRMLPQEACHICQKAIRRLRFPWLIALQVARQLSDGVVG
jgi:hypothetical protein